MGAHVALMNAIVTRLYVSLRWLDLPWLHTMSEVTLYGPSQVRPGSSLGKTADRDRCQNDTRRHHCIAWQTLLVRQAWTG